MARKKGLTSADLLQAVLEYQNGLSVDEVSKKLQFNRKEMSDYLRDNGYLRRPRGRVQWVDSEHIRCSKCNVVKFIDEIVYNTNNHHLKNGSYLSYCKACRLKASRKNQDGRPVPWAKRLSRIKSRCVQTGVEYALSVSDMEELWERQQGLCVYTQEPMINEYGSGTNPHNVSVDRIDYRKGYVPGNIVLCTTRANTIKHNQTVEELAIWMPLWHSRLMKLMEE